MARQCVLLSKKRSDIFYLLVIFLKEEKRNIKAFSIIMLIFRSSPFPFISSAFYRSDMRYISVKNF